MADAFKCGEIVQLKSGGPKMTVNHSTETPKGNTVYSCQWFAGSKLESGVFAEDSLKTPPADPKPL